VSALVYKCEIYCYCGLNVGFCVSTFVLFFRVHLIVDSQPVKLNMKLNVGLAISYSAGLIVAMPWSEPKPSFNWHDTNFL